MLAWRDEFNGSHPEIHVQFEQFTGKYCCVRVGKTGDVKTSCAGHLYMSHPEYGNAVAFDVSGVEDPKNGDGSVLIHAEDPSFFERLCERILFRYKMMQ